VNVEATTWVLPERQYEIKKIALCNNTYIQRESLSLANLSILIIRK
jgi:hypothetical protein